MRVILQGKTIIKGQTLIGSKVLNDDLVLYMDPLSAKIPTYKNLLPNNIFSTTSWAKIRCTCNQTSEVTAPDGTYTAHLMNITDGSALVRLVFNGPLIYDYDNINEHHVFSVYVKQKNCTASIFEVCIYNANYTQGVEDGFQIQNEFTPNSVRSGKEYIGDGWYRIYTSFNPTSNNYAYNAFFDFQTNTINGEGLYIWGPQFELGTSPSVYENKIKELTPVIGNNVPLLNNGAAIAKSSGGFFMLEGTNYNISNLSTNAYEYWTINYFQQCNLIENNIRDKILLNIKPTAGDYKEGHINWNNSSFFNLNKVFVASDQKIYVGGQLGGYNNTFRMSFVKINEDGSLNDFNLGYGDGGVVNTYPMAEDSNGLIYIRGTNVGGAAGTRIVDSSGSSIGITQMPATAYPYASTGMVIDSPNNIIYLTVPIDTILTENQTPAKGLIKLQLETKTVITTFETSTSGFDNGVVSNVYLDANKDIFAIGTFTSYKSVSAKNIVKLNKLDASIDTSFDYGVGFNGVLNAEAFAIQNDGKILVGGAFTTYNNITTNRIVRLNTNGSIDDAFTIGTGFNNQVITIILQSDQKIIVLGTFSKYNETNASRIIRLNTDGSIDTTFQYGSGLNGDPASASIQSDGKIIVIGINITQYNGTTVGRIVRINTNGTVDNTFINAGFNKPLNRTNMTFWLQNNTQLNNYGGLFGIGNGRFSFYNTNYGAHLYNNTNMFSVTFSEDKYFRFYFNGVYKNRLYSTNGLGCKIQIHTILGTYKLNNFMLYNRPLNSSEILQNYDILKSRYPI